MREIHNEREAVENMVGWWILAALMGVVAFWVGVGITIWALVQGFIL